MDGSKETGFWQMAHRDLGADEEKLDRALVAGLILEVILETTGSPSDPQAYRHLVKTRLQDTLVSHLAGRVTLDRFHHLVRQLDRWFPHYYPLVTASSPQGLPAPAAPVPPARTVLRQGQLLVWLRDQGRSLLPRRPHRKLDHDKLWNFLGRTQGGWFRLKDFEQHFGVDRKTAWEYLQKFLHAGLLRHNRKHSAAVRYALATRFLLVRADALEARLDATLPDIAPSLVAQVAGMLIATSGEAFWPDEWHHRLEPRRCQQVINRLTAAGVLERVGPVGDRHLLKLARRWLQD
jgi:hypothetical protein